MFDTRKFIDGLHDYIARAIAPISDRLDALEARKPQEGPKGDRGEKGDPGNKGLNAFEIAQSLGYDGTVHEWMDSLKGEKGDQGPVGEVGPEGPAGKDGSDGKNADPEMVRGVVDEVLPALIEEKALELTERVDSAIAAIPTPKDGEPGPPGSDGKDGANGKDGESVTVEDIRPLFDAALATWELEFERRAQDVLQRAIDRMPAPKDGVDGKDGRDGLGFEDLKVESDGERRFTFRMERDGAVKQFEVEIPAMLYRGVWEKDRLYEVGDVVTWSGCMWVAKKSTRAKPGEYVGDWQMAVKAGRPGKDAK